MRLFFHEVSEDLRGFIIAMLTLNMLCLLASLLLNVFPLITLIFVRSLQTASNSLLGALCVSDIAVAIFVQIIYQAMLQSTLSSESTPSTGTFVTFAVMFALCRGTLCLVIALISLDRFTAVCQPFFYLGRVTVTKYLTICGSVCSVWTGLCIIVIGSQSDTAIYCTLGFCMTFSLAVIIFCCTKILMVVRQQRRRVQTVGKISGTTNTGSRRQREGGKAFFIVIEVMVFVVGNLPSLMALLRFLPGDVSNDKMLVWTNVVILATNINCVINPLIYCLRSTDIRKGAKKLFKRSDYW